MLSVDKYLLLIVLILRPKGSRQEDFAQMLLRSGRILEFQRYILRVSEIELREIQLSGSHEIILQTPVVIENLRKPFWCEQHFFAKQYFFFIPKKGSNNSLKIVVFQTPERRGNITLMVSG